MTHSDPNATVAMAGRGGLAWQRIPDLLCWPFAGWTILCHLTVVAGGGLRTLLSCTAGVAVGSCILWFLRTRHRGAPKPERPPQPRASEPAPASGTAATARHWLAAGGAAALASAGVLALTSLHWQWTWWAIVVFLALASIREELGTAAAASATAMPPRPTAGQNAVVWLLVVLAMATALCLQRPDLDDTFYLNLSVAAADHPDEPLLCCDSLHGVPEVEINFPSQRLRALELLSGALAWLTGIAPIYWSHLLFPVLGALLLVTAYGRLLQWLVPNRWLACLAAVLVILAVTGGPHAWYGNMAFIRLHQGKAIFATALVPLLLAYSIELARDPSRRRWLALALANIAAIGLTPSALWVAPAVSALGLLSAVPRDRRGSKLIALGLLATSYAWGTALILSRQMAKLLDASVAKLDSATLLERASGYVLGSGDMRTVSIAAVLFAWWFCRPGPTRRFCLTLALGFVAVLFNPYLAKWLAGTGTSAFTYWRVFWVLPLPLLIAICLTAPMGWWGEGWPEKRRWQASLLVGAAFLLLAPRWTWEQRRAHFTLPGLRVPPAYELAREMAAVSPSRSQVLAPFEVSAWLPTFHHHPYPLVTRPSYLETIFEGPERRRRNRLTALVSRAPKDGKIRVQMFDEAIERYQLQAIAVRTDLPYLERLEVVMREHGFVVFNRWGILDLWLTREQANKIRQARVQERLENG